MEIRHDGASTSTMPPETPMPHENGEEQTETPVDLRIPVSVQDVRGETRDKCRRLYHAAKNGRWKTAERIFKKHPDLLNEPITDETKETAFHVAVGAHQIEFVKLLVEKEKNNLKYDVRDVLGNTAFCTAAIVGASDIIKFLYSCNSRFIFLRGASDTIPIYSAALFGHKAIVLYLYNDSKVHLKDEEKKWLFFTCLRNEIFDVAGSVLADFGNCLQLHLARDAETQETALHVLARNPSAFASQGIWKRLTNSSCCFGSSRSCVRPLALNLLKVFLSRISEENWDVITALIRQPQNLLLEAAELGNYDFLHLLIQYFPSLIWEKNDKGHTIFHIAILKRRLDIFELIRETGLCYSTIQLREDDHGNNILHLASKRPAKDILNNVSGEALQMQKELLFFEALKKFFPPAQWNKRNSKNKTPKELFSQRHNRLMKRGEKWMKKTATSCLLVATLIVTVVYPATFTVPGNNNNATATVSGENKSSTSNVAMPSKLAILNTVAMASSLTAIMMFFFILISRYQEKDFIFWLPVKFKFGLFSLFVSVATMTASFCLASAINYVRHGPEWVNYFIFSSPSIPVITLIFSLLYRLLRKG